MDELSGRFMAFDADGRPWGVINIDHSTPEEMRSLPPELRHEAGWGCPVCGEPMSKSRNDRGTDKKTFRYYLCSDPNCRTEVTARTPRRSDAPDASLP